MLIFFIIVNLFISFNHTFIAICSPFHISAKQLLIIFYIKKNHYIIYSSFISVKTTSNVVALRWCACFVHLKSNCTFELVFLFVFLLFINGYIFAMLCIYGFLYFGSFILILLDLEIKRKKFNLIIQQINWFN